MRNGQRVDLSVPLSGESALAYLFAFREPWAAISRVDGGVSARLSCDARAFPVAWFWQEHGGAVGPPWNGLGAVIGIEPCSSWPAHGLRAAAERSEGLVELAAHETKSAWTELTVLKGTSHAEDR